MHLRTMAIGLLTTATLTLAPLAVAAPVKPGPEPAVPDGCSLYTQSVDRRGTTYQITYNSTTDRLTKSRGSDPKWPWTPVTKAVVFSTGGGGDSSSSLSLVVAPDGTLYSEDRTQTGNTVTRTLAVNATGWAGTEQLMRVDSGLLRRTATGLQLYPVVGANTSAPRVTLGSPMTVPGSWSDVADIAGVARTSGATVLYVVRDSGALDQVVLPDGATPTPTITPLRASGFTGVINLMVAPCDNGGTALLGIYSGGEVRAWYDPDVINPNGADIVGGSRPIATGFKDPFYLS